MKETQDSITVIREQAIRTGETMGKLGGPAPVLMLIGKAEGNPREVYAAMNLICQQFGSWLLKNPPSSSLIKKSVKSLTDHIKSEMSK